MKIVGYINIYKSGFYHKPGKPGAFDLHPGDIYFDRESCLEQARPKSHVVLVAVPIEFTLESFPHVNPVRRNE